MGRIPGKNMTAKILSVILASILWIYVMNEQNPPVESTFTVPLESRNMAEGLVLVDAPEAVRVKVRGPRSIVAGALPKDLKAYVDAKGLREGRHSTKVYAQVPTSLELIEVNPDKLNLRIDAAQQRQLPIEIRLSGNSAAGAVLARATSNTANVSVEGPRSLIDTVEKVVAVIDLTGKNADYTTSVVLLALNREGKEVEGVAVNPGKINVNINLVRGANKKIVDIKPTVFGDLPSGVSLKRITTDPEKIEISGDPETLQKMDFIYTEPINLNEISKDSVKEVKLQLRDGLIAAKSSISVRIAVDISR